MELNKVKDFFNNCITDEQAELVLQLMNDEIDLDPFEIDDRFPGTQKWCRQCLNPPSDHDLILSALNDVVDGCGIEVIREDNSSDGKIIAEYVNTGDTCSGTIVYDKEKNEFIVTTMADWVEGWEAEQSEEEGLVRCGYCSHMTPIQNDDWYTTICENCENCVSG